MHMNINKETCKRIEENPNQTELERMLAKYALRLSARIGKLETEKNDLKQLVGSFLFSIDKNHHYIIHNFLEKRCEELRNMGGVDDNDEYITPKEVLDAAKSMFPPMNPPFSSDGDDDEESVQSAD